MISARKSWPSPVPELSFLPTPYRGWTRAGKKRVQDNLHAHAQNESIKNHWKLLGPNHATLLASMCRARPFSAHALLALWINNIFFDVDIVAENKSKCGLSWSELLSATCTRHNSYPKHFSHCFCMLSGEFANVFESNVWRVQVAHLHNAARALSIPSRCFQLSSNLDLWYCGKNKSNVV